MTKVFVDSSVLFSAVLSLNGASARIFAEDHFQLYSSLVVLAEVERNINKKLSSLYLKRFFMLVKRMIVSKNLPNEALLNQAKKVIALKDAVILSEAKRLETDFLVTLDKKHFLQNKVEEFLKPQKVLLPRDLFGQ